MEKERGSLSVFPPKCEPQRIVFLSCKRFLAFHFLRFLYGTSKTLKSLVSGFDLNLII